MRDTIRRKDFPADFVFPEMNTWEEYKRPSIHSDHGQYFSKTFWYPREFFYCAAEIHLVWFNQSGWYHSVQLETCLGPKHPLAGKREYMTIEHAPPSPTWRDGCLVPLVAQSAEEALAKLVAAHNTPMPRLMRYVLKKKLDRENGHREYFDAGRKLNPALYVLPD